MTVLTPYDSQGAGGEAGSRPARLRAWLRQMTLAIVVLYACITLLGAALLHPQGFVNPVRLLAVLGFGLASSGLLYWLLRRAAQVVDRSVAELSLRGAEPRLPAEAFFEMAEKLDQVFWFGHPERLELHYVSPAYEAIFGYSPEVLRANPTAWLADVHPDDRERVMAGMVRYATGQWDDTFRIVRPDGGIRWIRANVYMARDAAGEVYRVAGFTRDVTEQYDLQEQLRQAQKMEPVGRLAGGIAHDFNNLLSVILSYSEFLLVQAAPNDPNVAHLEEIRRASERAAELTQQLLAFSRQQILRPRVLDLSQILLGMERMLRRLLREDIELRLCVAGASARVHADPSQIEQVVMNLAVNARDAMPAGGKLSLELADVELDESDIAAHPGAAVGRHVRLAVTDTGVGMDAGTRQRMFDPFYTTKDKGKGTGLGLSTVFGVVKQSRGHLRVSSEVGHGTRIEVYLPATNLVEDGVQPERELPLIPIQGWETVLLVEDDEQVRGATRAILSHYGYRILDAGDGAEATATCASYAGEIHLLLSDMVMPGISGLLLAQQLAAIRPGMKTLLMSGYTDNEAILEGGLTAAVPFLAKPFTPARLLREVRRALSNHAGQGAQDARAAHAPRERPSQPSQL